jgi:flagellar biosynthesis regulator FlaF
VKDARRVRELRLKLRQAELKDMARDELAMKAAAALQASAANIEAVQSRNDVWRNLITACAFERGRGNERPITEVIEESFPQLLRGST